MRSVSKLNLLIISAALLVYLAACGEARDEPRSAAVEPTSQPRQTIVLGDVDPDEPTKKIKRFQPLADYLAENLNSLGIQEGKVLIARDVEEMGEFMRTGRVDVYFDSSFPTLVVQNVAGSEIVLRRWKGDDPVYWNVFITRTDSGVGNAEDFVGKVIAFEEPRSTSGFVLPAGMLVDRGFKLKEVEGPDAEVGPEEIGYFFSGDEQNTAESVLQGRVSGGAFSNQDYDGLSAELKQQIKSFDHTITEPRQPVSVRPGLGRPVIDEVVRLLSDLDQTPEGRELLDGLKKTKKFDLVTDVSPNPLSDSYKRIWS